MFKWTISSVLRGEIGLVGLNWLFSFNCLQLEGNPPLLIEFALGRAGHCLSTWCFWSEVGPIR